MPINNSEGPSKDLGKWLDEPPFCCAQIGPIRFIYYQVNKLETAQGFFIGVKGNTYVCHAIIPCISSSTSVALNGSLLQLLWAFVTASRMLILSSPLQIGVFRLVEQVLRFEISVMLLHCEVTINWLCQCLLLTLFCRHRHVLLSVSMEKLPSNREFHCHCLSCFEWCWNVM